MLIAHLHMPDIVFIICLTIFARQLKGSTVRLYNFVVNTICWRFNELHKPMSLSELSCVIWRP